MTQNRRITFSVKWCFIFEVFYSVVEGGWCEIEINIHWRHYEVLETFHVLPHFIFALSHNVGVVITILNINKKQLKFKLNRLSKVTFLRTVYLGMPTICLWHQNGSKCILINLGSVGVNIICKNTRRHTKTLSDTHTHIYQHLGFLGQFEGKH